MHKSHLVVVGSGGQAYREYSFAALARGHRVSAVLAAEPTWQRSYLDGFAVADLTDADAVADAVTSLGRDATDVAVLTWDETVLETTARAAEKLGLPHMSTDAVSQCRDKYRTRFLVGEAGLPAVRHRLVTSAAQAISAAQEIGYPVVVKPRALAGSVGVVKAEDDDSVRQAFEIADSSRYGDLPTGHGVLVEEYLDGPEISVDSVVFDGQVQCVHVAHKRLGFQPYFEEVGHLIADWSHEPWSEEVRQLVTAAHHALGVERGVTHTEVRLTPSGARLIELNGRLGGDLIPYASELATGVDLVIAAAELAFGRVPRVSATRGQTAEIRFLYPPFDCVVQEVDVAKARSMPGIAHAEVLAAPGSHLLLPPRSAIPRVAVLVAVGQDEQDCAEMLANAEPTVAIHVVATAG